MQSSGKLLSFPEDARCVNLTHRQFGLSPSRLILSTLCYLL